jgi:hypothetical protein
MSRITSCSCVYRSVWEDPCDWCLAQPKPVSALTYQDYARQHLIENCESVDDWVGAAAIELEWRAELSVSGFPDPSQWFESGGGI